eukprot:CAMPEP_0202919492 /NCGR_PEP_ID=MMETSP1392-20130828/75997_1 /ASSEMBLY_ACC=CAM_ASM_000868 /TAXON_ID=225041 /ORGANISM="Chlamydomonas chlamydogama, Strain SAG 11-48b" /LENGTH=41 /DNA_ID= /DNA_START= /DNA_END= /DNA_ORIENTATION=
MSLSTSVATSTLNIADRVGGPHNRKYWYLESGVGQLRRHSL